MIKNTTLKHWHLIADDPSLNGKFREPPLFVYRRGPNLRNRVVRVTIHTVSNQTPLASLKNGNYPCGNCAQCNSTQKAFEFKHSRSGKSHPARGVVTCNTKNVIHILKCPCDKVLNCGKTTCCLKQRMSEHKVPSDVQIPNYPVACHFTACTHPASSLRFQGIEQVRLPQGETMTKDSDTYIH